jgi:hypothetical protein
MTTWDKAIELKNLTENCLFYEYTAAADPMASGTISHIPFADFSSELHESGSTRIIPLDISAKLGFEGSAAQSRPLR